MLSWIDFKNVFIKNISINWIKFILRDLLVGCFENWTLYTKHALQDPTSKCPLQRPIAFGTTNCRSIIKWPQGCQGRLHPHLLLLFEVTCDCGLPRTSTSTPASAVWRNTAETQQCEFTGIKIILDVFTVILIFNTFSDKHLKYCIKQKNTL